MGPQYIAIAIGIIMMHETSDIIKVEKMFRAKNN